MVIYVIEGDGKAIRGHYSSGQGEQNGVALYDRYNVKTIMYLHNLQRDARKLKNG